MPSSRTGRGIPSGRADTLQRVLIVDDDPALRRLITRVIERVPGFEVAAEASNGQVALRLALEDPPDIVLTDIEMPEMDGIELTARLLEALPHLRVIALTGVEPGEALSRMIRNGAIGYLVKTASIDEMIQALLAVARGHAVLAPEVTALALSDLVQHYRSEQQRAASLQAMDAMKRDFMNVISHELRTPLTIIKGGVQTLKRGAERLDADQKGEFLDSIEDQALRLQRMIDQVLMVSQIEKGRGTGTDDWADLSEVVRSVIRELPEQARNRIQLDVTPQEVLGSANPLKHIVQWLLENAVAFSDEDIHIRSLPRTDGDVLIEIADRGVGMDAGLIHRVLTEPFTQNDSSTTRERDGLGLSLYAARQVVESLGGSISINSTPGAGTTVTVRLQAGPMKAQTTMAKVSAHG